MKKIKIFYSIEDNFPPYRVDIVELFNHVLKTRGLEVEWYMRRVSSGSCSTEIFAEQLVHLPYHTSNPGIIGKIVTKIAFWAGDVWQLLRCLKRPLSLIQVRDKYIAAFFGLGVARLKGVPFVYWCSYPFPEHYLERAKTTHGLYKLYNRLHGLIGIYVLYRFVMYFSDHVFVQSEQMKKDLVAYGVPFEKMTPISMGVPQKLTRWVVEHAVKVVPMRIVYLGTMASIRQLHTLIDAFAIVHERFPQASLFMVGDGDVPQERLNLEQQVEILGLSQFVHFTGFVPIEEAWSLSASAAVCVSPFYPTKVLLSASPTKLVEYMAMGRPVVCNDHPEQSDVIRNSGGGICVTWGRDSFAEAISWMLKNPEQAEEMGKKGSDWVVKNRTYPIIAEAVWDKYQEILKD